MEHVIPRFEIPAGIDCVLD